LLYLYEYVSCW